MYRLNVLFVNRLLDQMRYLELALDVGNEQVKAFKAIKRFDPNVVMGPTLALLRARQPLRFDTDNSERLRVFTSLLVLLDELTKLKLAYELTLNEGPPTIVDGTPVWIPVPGTREDVVRIIEQQRLIEIRRQEAEEFQRAYRPPDKPESLKLLEQRWGQLAFEELLPAERAYVCLWTLKVEVENGTFHQYFLNSAGDYAQHALSALQSLGAARTATMLADALNLFRDVGGFTPDRQARWERLNQLPDDVFEPITARFYERTEDILGMALHEIEKTYLEAGLIGS